MIEFDFEKDFKLIMNVMKIMQCHPNMIMNKYWVLNTMAKIGPYLFAVYNLNYSFQHFLMLNDYVNAFKCGVPIIYQVWMIFNFITLLKSRPMLVFLIKSMKDDYTRARVMNAKQKGIVHAKLAEERKVMYFWFFLLVTSVFSFIAKSIFLDIYHYVQNGYIKLYPFFDMYYPFKLTERREQNLVLFVASYLYEMYFSLTSILFYFCTFPLGIVFILHACSQLELIAIKFDNIFEKHDVDEKLNEIVKDLQYVYSFAKKINESFTVLYELMIKLNILLLPVTAYAIIQSVIGGGLTFEFVGIFLQCLTTCTIPCYYGDLLMQKGEEVRLAAYNCGWERVYKPSARKTLLIILTKALRPVAIQSIFCMVNLDTLSNVYKQAYTIFNLMSAMW